MLHTFTTILIPFDRSLLADVDAVLDNERQKVMKGGSLRNDWRNQGIHFLSFLSVPGDERYDAHLLLESVSDRSFDELIGFLAHTMPDTFYAAFASAGLRVPDNTEALERFLHDHRVKTGQGLFDLPGLNFVGIPGMTVSRILMEFDFADVVRRYVDGQVPKGARLERLQALRAQIKANKEVHKLVEPIVDEGSSDQKWRRMSYPNLWVAEDITLLGKASGTGSLVSQALPLAWRAILKFSWPVLILLGLIVLLCFSLAVKSTGWGVGIFVLLTALLLSLVVFGVIVGFFYFKFRGLELSDLPDDSPPEASRLLSVMALEDDGDNNHLFGVSYIKPGWLRGFALRLGFWVIGQFGARVYRPGYLADLGTIHFARWVKIPKTDRLLFLSNYSGSWESYLEDFITKASFGLTAAWSNTYGFPRTKNLFLEGAADGDRFKRWARRQQYPSRFWYRAYPNTSTAIIRRNAAIRHGLITASTEDEATQWFALFGSRQPLASSIESDRVQSLLFGGQRHLRDAQCYLVSLPEQPRAAREWLSMVLPAISFGDAPPQGVAHYIALSGAGLKKLGLSDCVLHSFPPTITQGMSHPARSVSILKDTGEDKQEKWLWGNQSNPVDAALIYYYNSSDNTLSHVAETLIDTLEDQGGTVIHQVDMDQLPDAAQPVREHFGFIDGISQPIIRGTHRWFKNQQSHHVAEPGEYLLGYPDDRGQAPASPIVPAAQDPLDTLPVYSLDLNHHDFPDYSESPLNQPRDLGKNGSYLVIRQIQQFPEKFWPILEAQADTLLNKGVEIPGISPGDTSSKQRMAEWLSAKVVGRWRDGTSLIRHPYEPGNGWSVLEASERTIEGNLSKSIDSTIEPDNDFFPGVEDPEGMRCPFGAHIRRTNPRDSFEPGSEEQLGITKRHRILRVGRSYTTVDTANSDGARGLFFMCLNADIQRQFEFIQQTWVMNRFFHGLRKEVDALLGRGKESGQLSIPTPQGPLKVQGLQDVVATRGGEYFFLPGRDALRYFGTPMPIGKKDN